MSTNITAQDLGIKVEKKERELFKWFLASYLFGKRIQQDIARHTWELFMSHGIDSPQRIANHSWQQLVDLLGKGNYKRYDESTAHNLLDMAHALIRENHGSLLNMYDCSGGEKDFMKNLQKLKGVGPKTAEIFMREAQPVLVNAK
ncbi:MAG: methylase [Candidatus Saccharibacteria bacterium]|nr:methylase [Candidatus Saccharibacteria bacterium]